MLVVWVATCVFLPQLIKFIYLPLQSLAVSSLSFVVYKSMTFFHGFHFNPTSKAVNTCINLVVEHGDCVVN